MREEEEPRGATTNKGKAPKAAATGWGLCISWPIVFLKAYALAAQEFPVLRHTFMQWLWPHLYEHPHHVGTLVLHREYDNEDWLFWGRFHDLETTPLTELQNQLDRYQSEPVEQIK